MYQRRPRRFRRRSNGRGHQVRGNGDMQRLRADSYSNDENRNRFRPPQSAEKLFEKYNTLAKEAMSSGDKTSSENYLQHADHFMRIIEDKNRNRDQNKTNDINKSIVDDKPLSENSEIKQQDVNKNQE